MLGKKGDQFYFMVTVAISVVILVLMLWFIIGRSEFMCELLQKLPFFGRWVSGVC